MCTDVTCVQHGLVWFVTFSVCRVNRVVSCNCRRVAPVALAPNLIIVVVCGTAFRSAMVLSIQERIFLVTHVFCEGDNYNDKVKNMFYEKIFTNLFVTSTEFVGLCRIPVKGAERSGRPSKIN